MKISLITTVLNEENQISYFIDSVLRQSLKPEELVIADAGSTDETIKFINNYRSKIKRAGIDLKVLVMNGANRSVGRNLAIKNSESEIIAVSDVGCILDKDWLKNLTVPFLNNKIKVVSGYYLAKTESIFEKCVAPFFCVMPDTLEKLMKKKDFEFLPSSRSLAFKKEVWKKVGGYPKELNYCEDLVFDQKIKKEGYNFFFASDAIVYWPQRKNLKEVFKQFYNYAVGDGMVFLSKYQTHSKRIVFLFFRYFLALLLLLLGLIFKIFIVILLLLIFTYLLKEILNKYKYVNNYLALIYLPIIKLVADVAVMFGATMGIIKSE